MSCAPIPLVVDDSQDEACYSNSDAESYDEKMMGDNSGFADTHRDESESEDERPLVEVGLCIS